MTQRPCDCTVCTTKPHILARTLERHATETWTVPERAAWHRIIDLYAYPPTRP